MLPETPAVLAIAARLADLGLTDGAEWLRRLALPEIEGALRALLLGRFSVGKSTLINAFLGYPVLPGGLAPTTGVTCHLQFGPPGARVLFQDGRTEEFSGPESVAPYLAMDPRDPSRANRLASISRVDIALPLALLRDGLEITDSPGLDEDVIRTRRAIAGVETADVVLVVLAADQLLGDLERQFLLQQLAPRRPGALGLIVNLWDRIPDAERPRVQQRLTAVLEEMRLEPSPVVFFISALQALRSRSQKRSELEKSGLPALEDWLQSLSQRREIVQMDAWRGRLAFTLERCWDQVRRLRGAEREQLQETESLDAAMREQLRNGTEAAERAVGGVRSRLQSLRSAFANRIAAGESRFRGRVQRMNPGAVAWEPLEAEIESWWRQLMDRLGTETAELQGTTAQTLADAEIDSAGLSAFQAEGSPPVPARSEPGDGAVRHTVSGLFGSVSPQAGEAVAGWMEKASRAAAGLDRHQRQLRDQWIAALQEELSLASYRVGEQLKQWGSKLEAAVRGAAEKRAQQLGSRLQEQAQTLREKHARLQTLADTEEEIERLLTRVR